MTIAFLVVVCAALVVTAIRAAINNQSHHLPALGLANAALAGAAAALAGVPFCPDLDPLAAAAALAMAVLMQLLAERRNCPLFTDTRRCQVVRQVRKECP